MDDKELYIKLLQEKLESVMPEVHRQVKIYEEREKAGTLKPLPKDNKTTMEEEKKQLISAVASQVFKNKNT